MNHPKSISIASDPSEPVNTVQQSKSPARSESSGPLAATPEQQVQRQSQHQQQQHQESNQHNSHSHLHSAHQAISPTTPDSRPRPIAARQSDQLAEASSNVSITEPSDTKPEGAILSTSPRVGNSQLADTQFGTKKRSSWENAQKPLPFVPTFEPLSHKRRRLSSHPRHTLDRFTFEPPSFKSFEPPSPLFFSHSSKLRPELPPRFSSSEAAATMLSKAKSEESHVKRVTLARGTVRPPSVLDGTPMRQSVGPSSISASPSPGPAVNKEVAPADLASIGIIELLDMDDRPTMIVDVGDHSNYATEALHPLYINPSMRSYPALLQIMSESHDAVGSAFLQFRNWLLSAVVNGESLDVCLPPYSFAGISWQLSTLRKRFRVISGTLSSETHPLSSAPTEEPLDYFGDAGAKTMVSNPTTTSPTVILQSTEMIDSDKIPHLARYTREVSSPLMRTMTPLAASIVEGPSFDWTRLPLTDSMPEHIKFARSVDWGKTALGPIETWSADLRQMCNMIMASPHPAAMYWGEELIAMYNEPYVPLAGQKHPKLMGQSYKEAWAEIWADVEPCFANATNTGEATMKDDDRLFLLRNNFLEETYFSWSIIPLIGGDGCVKGLYNPAFEKTRRKVAERRMLTLREIGERTASARDVKAFWKRVLSALELNEYDTPFVLLYSVTDDVESDASSMYSSSLQGAKQCVLEGTLGVPDGHQAAPALIDLNTGGAGFGPVFREVMKTDKPVLLEVGTRDLPTELVSGLHSRGFDDPCQGVVVCPIHPTTGDTILGFLVVGVNPRRPYDEDYSLFVQLLSRQLATSLASVVLFEEEIRRGQIAAKLAAADRIELSQQLAARTQEAIESETKFTRMAEFAPVGMFIANPEGKITYCNNTWFDISHVGGSRKKNTPDDHWMDAVKDDDIGLVQALWRDLIDKKEPQTGTFRFKAPWQDSHGIAGERWVLFSAYPEKYASGALKSVFGSLTDISKQKWAEDFQKRKMEEAVELKKSLEKFVDMTSHEMRNPLSAILQCADDIKNTMILFQTDINEKGLEAAMNHSRNNNESTEDAVSSAIDSAQTIMLCAQHQKKLTDDILCLSKLDSQLLLITPVDVQPVTVAERALKMHAGELQTADIRLEFVVDPSYSECKVDWVQLDPSRVLQILINLITNAIKFTTTESKRTITVTIAASKGRPSESKKRIVNYFPSRKKPSDIPGSQDWGHGEEIYIHFAVQDTGRGLSDEERKMLFLRFSQASPRTHVQYGGSGLGLFISRELTELQGGEIGVASEAGVGSTFAFYVKAKRSSGPAVEKAPNHMGQSAKSLTSASTKTKAIIQKAGGFGIDGQPIKVLIVEDNLVNQRVMQKQLKKLGCTVYTANHGGEALELLEKSTYWNHAPDSQVSLADRIELSVVLMDQEMPVMDGLTCTKKIRELEEAGKFIRHVPIIAVTANARKEQIETALNIGMDAVQAKPFTIPELMESIKGLCERMELG